MIHPNDAVDGANDANESSQPAQGRARERERPVADRGGQRETIDRPERSETERRNERSNRLRQLNRARRVRRAG